ncbi:MAG: hypothetical protein ACI8WB_004193, partial [Phenylobacterium sp.]
MKNNSKTKRTALWSYLNKPVGTSITLWRTTHKSEIEEGLLPSTFYGHFVEKIYEHRFGKSLIPILIITLATFISADNLF